MKFDFSSITLPDGQFLNSPAVKKLREEGDDEVQAFTTFCSFYKTLGSYLDEEMKSILIDILHDDEPPVSERISEIRRMAPKNCGTLTDAERLHACTSAGLLAWNLTSAHSRLGKAYRIHLAMLIAQAE